MSVVSLLLPPVWRCQIEAHEIHRGKEPDVRFSLSVALSTIRKNDKSCLVENSDQLLIKYPSSTEEE
ncbi:hypothetical protein TNCV_1830581 [Trichonephila clavipes]|nr:hypothetical protein TNCV_1830581 [Trichonephila clavipes]